MFLVCRLEWTRSSWETKLLNFEKIIIEGFIFSAPIAKIRISPSNSPQKTLISYNCLKDTIFRSGRWSKLSSIQFQDMLWISKWHTYKRPANKFLGHFSTPMEWLRISSRCLNHWTSNKIIHTISWGKYNWIICFSYSLDIHWRSLAGNYNYIICRITVGCLEDVWVNMSFLQLSIFLCLIIVVFSVTARVIPTRRLTEKYFMYVRWND